MDYATGNDDIDSVTADPAAIDPGVVAATLDPQIFRRSKESRLQSMADAAAVLVVVRPDRVSNWILIL